jgi:hypothetical protein
VILSGHIDEFLFQDAFDSMPSGINGSDLLITGEGPPDWAISKFFFMATSLIFIFVKFFNKAKIYYRI